MTTVRRITVSQVEGDSAGNTTDTEIRPFGETAFYIDQDGEGNRLTLMMFDGVRTHLKSKVVAAGRLYGCDADSGDGNNYDTIKLIPDATIHSQGSDQYIIVDPTAGEPGHIHLRAGGTQDSSSADLYLGGELTCIRISDTSDNVIIRTPTFADPNISQQWTFDTAGNIQLPAGGDIRDSNGNTVLGGGGGSSDRLTSSTFNVILEGTTGTVSIPNSIISQSYQLNLAASDYGYSIGRYLRIRDGDIESHIHLDTPDNDTYDIILGNDSKFVRVDHTGTVVIGVDYNNTIWTFTTAGNFILPPGGDIVDNSGSSVIISTAEPRFEVYSNTSSISAETNRRYGVDTLTSATTISLPMNPALGDTFFVADAGGAFASNNLTIDRNGMTINGSASDLVLNTNGDSIGMFWNGTTWRLYE